MDQNNAMPAPPPMGAASKSLEAILEEYLVKKAPFALPAGLKEFIVKVSPWLALIGIIISLPFILMFLGFGSFLYAFGAYGYRGSWFYLELIITAVTIVLEALAIPGLFKRELKAWRLVYYAALLQIVNSLLGGGIIGALISGLISLYFIFQIKEYYK